MFNKIKLRNFYLNVIVKKRCYNNMKKNGDKNGIYNRQ